MGTRCITLVDSWFTSREYDEENDDWKLVNRRVPIARIYRHFDGYPDGHGRDIAMALKLASEDAEVENRLNNRNWAQHFLGRLCQMDADLEFEPASESAGWYAHGDLEFIYRVTGNQDYTGGKEDRPDFIDDKVTVEWWGVRWDEDMDPSYSRAMSKEPSFSGNWVKVLRWLDNPGA